MNTTHEQIIASPGGETVVAIDGATGEGEGAAVMATRDQNGTTVIAVFTDPTILDALTEVEGIEAALPPKDETDPNGWADLLASRFIRAHRAISARIDAFDKQEAKELDFIRRRFAELRAPEEKSLAGMETALLTLAQQVTYPKGARSRKVAYGSYGLHKVPGKPAKLAIESEDRVIAWLKEHAPDLVSEHVETTFDFDRDKVLELATSTEVVPDGLAIIPPVPEGTKLVVKHVKDDAAPAEVRS